MVPVKRALVLAGGGVAGIAWELTNPLSPATRAPAARAGREVGRASATQVAAFWT
jgi:NTE family protein